MEDIWICTTAIAIAVAVVIWEERKMAKHTHGRFVEAKCTRCEATYQQEQTAWAVHNTTGEKAGGWHGHWYGSKGPEQPWEEGEFHIVWENVYPYGGPYDVCDPCLNDTLNARERMREFDPPCAPRWFDPSHVGERWDDEY